MNKNRNKPDRLLFFIVITLMLVGFFIFTSAAFGLLASNGANFQLVVVKQLVVGVVMGLAALFVISTFHYKKLRSWAVPIFVSSVVLNLLVFIPGLGFSAGGATRWLALGPITIQPAEFLKLGTVLFFAYWFSLHRERVHTLKYGFAPFVGILAIVTGILISQPDTGTLIVIVGASLGIFLVAGASWKHIGLVFAGGLVGLILLASFRPYVRERLTTFINPDQDQLGSSYQLRQSLIAIGSGGIMGRGFGQSVQKFNYLPEAIGDSIFAVAGEEFGFVGSSLLVVIFLAFGLRGLKIAAEAPDTFSRLTVVGLVILITAQSFINMGAMLGILPLTGVPLLFVSHGGTALFFALIEVGIILNVSRYSQS